MPLLQPVKGIPVEIFQRGPDQYGLIHLCFRQFVAESEAMGEFSRLSRMSRDMGLELFHIPLSQYVIQFPVKIGEPLFKFSFIHISTRRYTV